MLASDLVNSHDVAGSSGSTSRQWPKRRILSLSRMTPGMYLSVLRGSIRSPGTCFRMNEYKSMVVGVWHVAALRAVRLSPAGFAVMSSAAPRTVWHVAALRAVRPSAAPRAVWHVAALRAVRLGAERLAVRPSAAPRAVWLGAERLAVRPSAAPRAVWLGAERLAVMPSLRSGC